MPDASTKPEDKKEEPKVEKYRLKQNETQLLVIMRNQQQSLFATMLSFIANERLGYQVTERTQFKLTEDLAEIEISELPPAEVPTNPAPEAKPEEPKDTSPVVSAK